MAFLGLKIPVSVVADLSGIQVPGKLEDPEFYHVTMLNFGDDMPIQTVMRAGIIAYEMGQKVDPFTCRVQRVENFSEGPNGYPIVGRVESPELEKLWEELCAAFDANAVSYSKKFPVFKPHVTLAYATDPILAFELPRPVQWTAEELNIWGGDEGESRIVVKIPLWEGLMDWML